MYEVINDTFGGIVFWLIMVSLAAVVLIAAAAMFQSTFGSAASTLPPNQHIAVYQVADGTKCYALMERDIPLGFSCK